MSDWDQSDDETKAPAAPAPAAPKVVLPKKSKFAGEDEGDKKEAEDDWDASSASESEKAPTPVVAAPTKKKGTLKAKLAEKEKLLKEKALNSDDDPMLEMTPQEKRRIQRQQELDADLANAADLLGQATISSDPLASIPFDLTFSQQVFSQIISKHTSNPLYYTFTEQHLRALVEPLKDSEVRKLATMLSAVANEKQQAARAAKGGKGAKKAAAKPALGGSKSVSATDTRAYEDALDDGDDDFM